MRYKISTLYNGVIHPSNLINRVLILDVNGKRIAKIVSVLLDFDKKIINLELQILDDWTELFIQSYNIFPYSIVYDITISGILPIKWNHIPS